MAAAPALALLLLVLLPAHQALATAAGDAHGAEADTCGPALGGAAGRRHGPGLEEYGGGRIVDITHAYRPGMPPDATAGPLVRLKESMENGSDYNLSELRMHCHMGTHVDAPGHMNQAHFAAGLDVDTLDLGVLNDPETDAAPEYDYAPDVQPLSAELPDDGALESADPDDDYYYPDGAYYYVETDKQE